MTRFQRQTAKKVRILDLNEGKWIEKDVGGLLQTAYGEELVRARLMATVVSKFTSEDGGFGTLTLDDSSDTIRAKCWKDLKPISSINVGDVVDMIGKVRMYNEEIYLVPETVKKVANPNLELLRKLEIMKQIKGLPKKEYDKETADDKSIRKEVLGLIEKNNDGIEYNKLLESTPHKQEEVERVIDELLSGGVCYEPTPGKIKKI